MAWAAGREFVPPSPTAAEIEDFRRRVGAILQRHQPVKLIRLPTLVQLYGGSFEQQDRLLEALRHRYPDHGLSRASSSLSLPTLASSFASSKVRNSAASPTSLLRSTSSASCTQPTSVPLLARAELTSIAVGRSAQEHRIIWRLVTLQEDEIASRHVLALDETAAFAKFAWQTHFDRHNRQKVIIDKSAQVAVQVSVRKGVKAANTEITKYDRRRSERQAAVSLEKLNSRELVGRVETIGREERRLRQLMAREFVGGLHRLRIRDCRRERRKRQQASRCAPTRRLAADDLAKHNALHRDVAGTGTVTVVTTTVATQSVLLQSSTSDNTNDDDDDDAADSDLPPRRTSPHASKPRQLPPIDFRGPRQQQNPNAVEKHSEQ
jgi:hypothetical protein